jgi:hypothetical protein
MPLLFLEYQPLYRYRPHPDCPMSRLLLDPPPPYYNTCVCLSQMRSSGKLPIRPSGNQSAHWATKSETAPAIFALVPRNTRNRPKQPRAVTAAQEQPCSSTGAACSSTMAAQQQQPRATQKQPGSSPGAAQDQPRNKLGTIQEQPRNSPEAAQSSSEVIQEQQRSSPGAAQSIPAAAQEQPRSRPAAREQVRSSPGTAQEQPDGTCYLCLGAAASYIVQVEGGSPEQP